MTASILKRAPYVKDVNYFWKLCLGQNWHNAFHYVSSSHFVLSDLWRRKTHLIGYEMQPHMMMAAESRRSLTKLIKLACESQLTEILFKLIIKLACESQLTEILFKLIKLACESQLTEILFKLIIIIILLRLNF